MIITLTLSCSSTAENPAKRDDTITTNNHTITRADTMEQTIDEYAIYYMVIPDTGKNYYGLRELMFRIHDKLKLPIDTMDRFYDVQKEQIIFPADMDDAYADEYFPRRFETYSLSIEHLSFYNNTPDQKAMALVAGIYESKISADSLAKVLHQNGFTAFVLKTNMYVGCMH